jgi:hypothetical protein
MNPLSIHKEPVSVLSLREFQYGDKVIMATKENRRLKKPIPFRRQNVKHKWQSQYHTNDLPYS